MEEKESIRKRILKKRNELSALEIEKLSGIILKKVTALKEFCDADNILIYASMRSEVRTDDIITEALSLEKNVFCPKCIDTENGVMDFVRIKSLDDLKTGYFGIREPELTDKCHVFGSDGADADYNKTLMLMPVVAFDAEGNRIGYGGGYYDRFLERFRGITALALAFEAQRSDSLIPCTPHDVRPQKIITEINEY